jgi:hypothetical protein
MNRAVRPELERVAEPGSAMTTVCPSASRCRATHSLSVEASRRIRARGRDPRISVNRSRDVAIRRSINSPSSREDAELALALVQIQSYRIHGGWPAELVGLRH